MTVQTQMISFESWNAKLVDNLVVPFEVCFAGVPVCAIEREIAIFAPEQLTLTCCKISCLIKSFIIDLESESISMNIETELLGGANKSRQLLYINRSLAETKKICLTGEWLEHIALSAAIKPMAKYVGQAAERRIEIDLQLIRQKRAVHLFDF
jgi:hypothetical protein